MRKILLISLLSIASLALVATALATLINYGDGTCDELEGENCATCPEDCACEENYCCDADSVYIECVPSGHQTSNGICCNGINYLDGICCEDSDCYNAEYVCLEHQCLLSYCGDGICHTDNKETCDNCPDDCGTCEIICGDTYCEGDEDCFSCPADCGSCDHYCGDNYCDHDESCSSCPDDCGECETPDEEEESYTTIDEVTVTQAAGGEVTATTDEETTASVDIPAQAVSQSTTIQIAPETKSTVTESRPLPQDKEVVGGYAYDYSAKTTDEKPVTSFNKDITLTFTYTDAQIKDLDESSLKIHYWDESTSQWIDLETTIDAANNTLTVTTNHFTYFAILGETIEEEKDEIMPIKDGDLIRNPDAQGMAKFDIYITKLVGNKKFKRLVISPHVFESYEHFDKNHNGNNWDDVVSVNQATMDSLTISDLVREDGTTKVYQLTATEGADTGVKQWLNATTQEFNANYDSDSIYIINSTDVTIYLLGTDITD